MTNEGESQTESWVEEKDARYPYAYDPGGKLKRELGVTGIPAAFLVDPTGKIVWQGHPGNLESGTIEKYLDGTISKPIYEWAGSAKKVKQAFLKNDFAKALAEAAKLAEDDPFGTEVDGILRGILERRMASYEGAFERGDILTAYEGAKSLSKGVKGLPEATRIAEMLKTISKDKQMKGWLKDQEKLRDIAATEVRRKKDCDEVIKQLEKLLKGNEGSFVGNQIEAKIKDMRQTKGKLSR